mgnify:CR=1 FL=1
MAFAAGFLLNFMPCVLPVIPIKVRILTAETGGPKTRISKALNMAFGTLSFFMLLSLFMQMFNLTWGEWFSNSWFTALIALLFFTFSLTLFFDISVIKTFFKLNFEGIEMSATSNHQKPP